MHAKRDRERLINRVRRLRGQVEAVEKAIENEDECSKVLLTVATCRGALSSLSSEMLEDFRFHVADPDANSGSKRARAAAELVEMVRAYPK